MTLREIEAWYMRAEKAFLKKQTKSTREELIMATIALRDAKDPAKAKGNPRRKAKRNPRARNPANSDRSYYVTYADGEHYRESRTIDAARKAAQALANRLRAEAIIQRYSGTILEVVQPRPRKAKRNPRGVNLTAEANACGYAVRTYSPGDGATRYRFFKLAGLRADQDYFGPANAVHTAVGAASARAFLAGLAKRNPVLRRHKTVGEMRAAGVPDYFEKIQKRGEAYRPSTMLYESGEQRPVAGHSGHFILSRAGSAALMHRRPVGSDPDDTEITVRGLYDDWGRRKDAFGRAIHNPAREPKPKFKVGDRVCDLDGARPGTVSWIASYSPPYAAYEKGGQVYEASPGWWIYKVQQDSGPNHHRNEINLRKIGGRKRPARNR